LGPGTGPGTAARTYLLLDVTANQMLAEKDIDMPVEPASLTKLMTPTWYSASAKKNT